MTTPAQHTVQYFDLCGYKYMHGPSRIDTGDRFKPFLDTFSVWKWNGHYWQIEIADATADLDEVKYALQFKIADEREALARAEQSSPREGKE